MISFKLMCFLSEVLHLEIQLLDFLSGLRQLVPQIYSILYNAKRNIFKKL
jgi:hypothetical protein